MDEAGDSHSTKFDEHLAGLDRDFTLFHGVLATLQRLRSAGYRMAVATNKPHPFVAPLLQEGWLDAIV